MSEELKNGMREVILSQEPKQAEFVNTITEDAPIVGNDVLFQAASNNIVNKYEKAREVVAPKRTDLDAPLQLLSLVSDLKETKLFKIAGLLELPQDQIEAATPQWVAQWMARKLPVILQAGMGNIEQSYLYDTLLANCLANAGRTINMNVAASGNNYFSILGCCYDAGQNVGLYNANRTNPTGGAAGAGDGDTPQQTFFRMQAMWNGGLGKLSNGASGYSWDVSAMLGFQMANEKKFKAIVNIDESHFPTYQQLIEFARDIRGNNARKHIYMSRTIADKILSLYTRASGDNSFSSLIVVDQNGRIRICGIPVTESDNFLNGSEKAIPTSAIAA